MSKWSNLHTDLRASSLAAIVFPVPGGPKKSMFRYGAWWDFVFAVALANCWILFWRVGCKMTSPKPFPFWAADPLPTPGKKEVKRREKPDQGYFAMVDSLTSDGCPNILST